MIQELLKEEYIFLEETPRKQALKQALVLISGKCSVYAGVKESDLTKAFLKREKIDSTGFGEGLAIPHAKVKRLQNPMAAFFRFTEGVDWKAVDGQPVRAAIALIMPAEDEDNTHLMILSELARKLVHQEFMDKLLNETEKGELYSYILTEMEE